MSVGRYVSAELRASPSPQPSPPTGSGERETSARCTAGCVVSVSIPLPKAPDTIAASRLGIPSNSRDDTGERPQPSASNVPKASMASACFNRLAAAKTAGGTQSGKGVSSIRCFPLAICTSRRRDRFAGANRFARRTNAGHNRRCTNVILASTRRHTRISADSRTVRVAAKIALLRGCDHQFPRTASPAISSTSEGTLWRREASQTTP